VIIGICGYAFDLETGLFLGTSRVGKGTVAKTISLFHDALVLGFADDMTSIFSRLGGRDGWLQKEIRDFRREKQRFGTEARLKAGCPSVWRDVLKTTVCYLANEIEHPIRRFVVEDMRYAEEAECLADLARIHRGVYRSIMVRRGFSRGQYPVPAGHSSEKLNIPKSDYTIDNDRSRQCLIWKSVCASFFVFQGGENS
jgi:hypothetical protein